ncbi:MAG TPA: MgtC/SapB family protein [Aquifex aeolicus]|uniref:MgtC/SapB family protein n=1 Tax=Aquifex aeolicus TaxID=63363 RepID=A0A9D0YMU3_AQUAO|nr:MgtC/SapB family protein [Aquificales bacterium]HIP86714.1 MgtC/SapB family protein [Aquifex sp.]HIP97860.1 MgtC/SapB family protein [Aquifex aeolicus]HIQ26208.1 MgtC/SapB family protein [Aquifex aeolicus]
MQEFFTGEEFKFLLSLLVGFLIGLEREIRGKLGRDVFAGIRTFPLISVLGTLSAWISEHYFSHFVLVSYLGLVVLSAVNYFAGVQRRTGITTEVAVFLTFTFGVLIYFGFYYETVFFAVVTTLLLATKRALEGFALHLSAEDLFPFLQFLVLSALIYPVLPDREIFYGFNPKSVWKFIFLVSSVSFIGYLLLKVYTSKGETKGLVKTLLITAVLGGSVSSTAVTLSYSKLSREIPSLTSAFFLGIVISWIIMAIRVLLLAGFIAPELLKPLISLFFPFIAVMFLIGLNFYLKENISPEGDLKLGGKVNLKNPFSWGEIVQFAAVYTAVAILGKILKEQLGDKGLLILAATSGVVDVDPITIALADMFAQNRVGLHLVLGGILLAVISNNFFKALYAYLFGSGKMKKLILFLVGANVFYTLIGLFVLKVT